jgi:ABC-type antimicrobial peptide transport system permease subunit
MLGGRFPYVGEPGVVAIDRKLAEMLGGENLVGQTIEIQSENNAMQFYTICGICERMPVHILGRDNNPSCFIYGAEDLLQGVYLKINPHNYKDALARIRSQIEEYSKIIPAFSIKTLEEKTAEGWGTSTAKIAIKLTGIALLLSLFGVYSSLSMETESRRREVAIRKVNGAEEWNIFVLFGKSYLIVLVIAWLLSTLLMIPIISLMSRNIEATERYNLGLVFYLIVLAVMVLITIATIFNKIWSISKINPAEVIKSE